MWTISKREVEGFRNIRRVDNISVFFTCGKAVVHDGHNIDLYVPKDDYENVSFLWKIVKVSPSTCLSLFRPSQNTVKINCRAKVGSNLAIDKDGSTVLLVPSNPKDKYQVISVTVLIYLLTNSYVLLLFTFKLVLLFDCFYSVMLSNPVLDQRNGVRCTSQRWRGAGGLCTGEQGHWESYQARFRT